MPTIRTTNPGYKPPDQRPKYNPGHRRRQTLGSVPWTPDRCDQLRELWATGMSASAIAKEMQGITRNSVISKAHRMGLPRRGSPIKRRTPE